MGEWKDLVRVKNIAKVFNTNWSRKVTLSTFEGDKDNKYQGEINVIVSASNMTDDVSARAEKEDLDKFLTSKEFSKLIVSDRVREYKPSEQPNFISGWETFVDNPVLDGELDHIRSKITEKRICYKRKEELIEINTYLLKKGLRPLLDIKGERMIRGERHFMFEAGRVPYS